jgi:hypothetical protein
LTKYEEPLGGPRSPSQERRTSCDGWPLGNVRAHAGPEEPPQEGHPSVGIRDWVVWSMQCGCPSKAGDIHTREMGRQEGMSQVKKGFQPMKERGNHT